LEFRDGTRIEFQLELENRRGVKSIPRSSPGRIPRVSRLMALAIKYDRLVRDGRLRDYAEIARLGQVSRARLSQIVSLLNLAPSLQEALLLLPRTTAGHDRVTEKKMRTIASLLDWEQQETQFRKLLSEPLRPAPQASYQGS
jgi:hypothetical protein